MWLSCRFEGNGLQASEVTETNWLSCRFEEDDLQAIASGT